MMGLNAEINQAWYRQVLGHFPTGVVVVTAMSDGSPAGLSGLRDEAWMAAPEGEPSRRAVDRLLTEAGAASPVPWEFEGLGTILSLVARGIGVAIVPRLALATGERRVAVRPLAGTDAHREVYAVARTASVRRPSVSAVLAALSAAAARGVTEESGV